MKYYFMAFKNYAKCDGRAIRKEFWWFILFHCLFMLVFSFADDLLGWYPTIATDYYVYSFGYGYLTIIYLLVSISPAICVQVRRLHDIGKSGYWYFICGIPIIGLYLFYLNLKPSRPMVVYDLTESDASNVIYGEEKQTNSLNCVRFCRQCGYELINGSSFCSQCGTEVVEQVKNIVFNTEQGEINKKLDDEQIDVPLSADSVDNVSSKKTKKNIKRAFCGICGSMIDKDSKKCTGCGKQYFRGIRLKPLLNCIFSVILLVSLFFNIMQYISYTDLKRDKNNVVSEKQGLENEVKKLKDKGNDAGYSMKLTKSELEALRKSIGSDKSSNTMTKAQLEAERKSRTDWKPIEYYQYDKDESCAIPSCSRSSQRNSFYCSSHECMDVGCHNQKANDFCSYCVNHKCAVSSCNSSPAYNSIYCYMHK